MKKQAPLEVATLGLQNVEADIIYVIISKQWEQDVLKIKITESKFYRMPIILTGRSGLHRYFKFKAILNNLKQVAEPTYLRSLLF